MLNSKLPTYPRRPQGYCCAFQADSTLDYHIDNAYDVVSVAAPGRGGAAADINLATLNVYRVPYRMRMYYEYHRWLSAGPIVMEIWSILGGYCGLAAVFLIAKRLLQARTRFTLLLANIRPAATPGHRCVLKVFLISLI